MCNNINMAWGSGEPYDYNWDMCRMLDSIAIMARSRILVFTSSFCWHEKVKPENLASIYSSFKDETSGTKWHNYSTRVERARPSEAWWHLFAGAASFVDPVVDDTQLQCFRSPCVCTLGYKITGRSKIFESLVGNLHFSVSTYYNSFWSFGTVVLDVLQLL